MEDIDHLHDPEQDQGGQKRASAVADQGKRDAGQGNELGLAADRQEGLEDVADRRPVGKELEKAVGIAGGQGQDPQKAADADQDQADPEDHPHLLHDGSENKV